MAVIVWDGSTSGDTTVGTNWVGDAVPGDGDSIVIPAWATRGLDGADMTASGTVQFVGFTVEEGFTGTIGSRGTYLQIDLKDVAAYADLNFAGRGQAYIDVDNYKQIIVTDAATVGAGQFGLNLIGLHDDGTAGRGEIFVNLPNSSASVGIGANAGEAMEANKIFVGGGTVEAGPNVSTFAGAGNAPTLDVGGGVVTMRAPATTVTVTAGTLSAEDAITITTLDIESGTVFYRSAGTVTTVNLFGGLLDMSTDDRARTFTNVNMYQGSGFLDPKETVTLTNDIDLRGTKLAAVTLELGTHITIGRSSI